jgi:hypothetical protein
VIIALIVPGALLLLLLLPFAIWPEMGDRADRSCVPWDDEMDDDERTT